VSPLRLQVRGHRCAVGTGGMVTTAFPTASEAAVEILRAGGNKPFLPSDGFLGLFTVPCPFRRASAVARNASQRFDVYE